MIPGYPRVYTLVGHLVYALGGSGRLVGYTLGELQHTPEKGQNKHVWYPYGTRVD